MNRQQALSQAAREVLHALVKESPYTSKYIARQVGEEYTTFSKRLRGVRAGYQQLDTALVVNVLTVIGVSFTDYATRVEERARELTTELPRS